VEKKKKKKKENRYHFARALACNYGSFSCDFGGSIMFRSSFRFWTPKRSNPAPHKH